MCGVVKFSPGTMLWMVFHGEDLLQMQIDPYLWTNFPNGTLQGTELTNSWSCSPTFASERMQSANTTRLPSTEPKAFCERYLMFLGQDCSRYSGSEVRWLLSNRKRVGGVIKESIGGQQCRTLVELKERIRQIWTTFDRRICRRMISSIPKRCQACSM